MAHQNGALNTGRSDTGWESGFTNDTQTKQELPVPNLHDASMNHPQLSIQASLNLSGLYADSRNHVYLGPTRNARLYRATPSGGGAISKSEDGVRCAITGKECKYLGRKYPYIYLICLIALRIIHLTDGSEPLITGQKSSVGRGGHRIDASRNLWDGSGLKMDCASTDVAWARGGT